MSAVAPISPSAELVPLKIVAATRPDDTWPRRLCWAALALLHITACAFFSLFTVVYTQISDAAFGSNTFLYDLIIPARYLPRIGVAFSVLGLLHLILLLKMLYASVKYRRLSFGLPARSTSSRKFSSIRVVVSTRTCPLAKTLQQVLTRPIDKVIGRRGWFGIDGLYFDHFFVVRELVQIVLQTIQLHKMARLVSTPWLLHVYVAILCANCWSSQVLQLILKRSPAALEGADHRRRRMHMLLLDSFLDNVATFFMPLVVVARYTAQYDHTLESFPLSTVGDDMWIMQVAADIQLLFVVGWNDFAMKLELSLLVLVSTTAIHDLCHDLFDAASVSNKKHNVVVVKSSAPAARMRSLIHASLVAWGLVLVGIHSYALSRPLIDGCLLPVQPWFEQQSSCAVYQYDCYIRASRGGRSETHEALAELSPGAPVYVIFRHCWSLEIPSNLQSLRNILGVKIYNATLANWSTDAALRADYHTSLRLVTMVRITFPNDGVGLPEGLVHPLFPSTVSDMNICVSNLKRLPSDLANKWPRGLSLLLEMSAFDTFPEVATRMDLSAISFNGNQITTVPVDKMLLPDRRLRILSLGDNPIVDLGNNVTKITLPPAFYWLVLDANPHLTTLPMWLVDPAVITRIWLVGSNTPVCADIQAARIAGSAPASTTGFYWQQFVDCSLYPATMRSLFRLFTEDARSSLDRDRIGDPHLVQLG